MASWSADLELELACKVGSLDNLERAVEEGADLNWDGGAPLFVAIMNRHRAVVERLVDLGVDPSPFLSAAQRKKAKNPEQLVEALWAAAPPPPDPDEAGEPPPGDGDEADG